MNTETLTREAFAALQTDLEKSRRNFDELLSTFHGLSSGIAALRITTESDPACAMDLASILEEYVSKTVDGYRKRLA